MKYWQAFALMPTLDKDQEKLLEQWSKVPLDAAALKLIEMSQGSLEYLHRGAKLLRCDWSLDYEDGSFLRLPYLPKARTLARLAALHARHEFEQGHWKGGMGRRDRPAETGPPPGNGPTVDRTDWWVTRSRRLRSRQRPPTCRS